MDRGNGMNSVRPKSRLHSPSDEHPRQGACHFIGEEQTTNAQFTVQPTKTQEEMATNIKRITLDPKDDGPITYVMKWTGPNTPVTFSVFYGSYTMSEVKTKTPDITWNEAPVIYFSHRGGHRSIRLVPSQYAGGMPTTVTVSNFHEFTLPQPQSGRRHETR